MPRISWADRPYEREFQTYSVTESSNGTRRMTITSVTDDVGPTRIWDLQLGYVAIHEAHDTAVESVSETSQRIHIEFGDGEPDFEATISPQDTLRRMNVTRFTEDDRDIDLFMKEPGFWVGVYSGLDPTLKGYYEDELLIGL